jgi:hypothetical protein
MSVKVEEKKGLVVSISGRVDPLKVDLRSVLKGRFIPPENFDKAFGNSKQILDQLGKHELIGAIILDNIVYFMTSDGKHISLWEAKILHK